MKRFLSVLRFVVQFFSLRLGVHAPRLVLLSLILLTTTLAQAHDSQFHFDSSGNLLAEAEAPTSRPEALGQPPNRIVAPGNSVSFSVVAANTRALTYQWRFNDTNIRGATTDSVLLPNVSTNHEGEYRVVLTNPSGSVTSAPAFLTIDSDADGMGDSWERTHFGHLNQYASADADGDGASNLQEFQDATDPTDSSSVRFRLLVLRDGGSVIKSFDRTTYTNGESVTLTAVGLAGQEPFHGWLGDIVTRSNPVTLVMTSNKTIYARFTPIAFTWTNLAGGDWNIAANWIPNLAPGSNDTVIIPNGTVTLTTPADCADLTLGSSNPTLTANGTLKVRGQFLWSSGTLTGSGRTILEPGATLELVNPGAGVFSLNGHTLENWGTILCSGAGSLGLNFGAVITNRPGGLFDFRNASGLSASFGANRFDNSGAVRKSANTGNTTVGSSVNGSGIAFNNSGTVEVQTGTLSLAGGGTHTGSFHVLAGGTLNWSGGTHSAGPSSSVTGAGNFTVGGGTATLAGLVNVSGSNTFSRGTANVTGHYICTNNTLTISLSGTANLSGTGEVSPAVLELRTGTLGGTSVVTVGELMHWTEGTMSGNGRTIIAPGAMATVSSPFGIQFSLFGRTLENAGTLVWSGIGSLGLFSGAVITNRPGALFHVQNARSISTFPGPGRIDNAGTFRKSMTNGTTTIASGIPFNNDGMVDLRNGILAANGGYVSTPNALLHCALGGTTPGVNYGQLRIGGAVTLNGALSVDLANGFSPAADDSFAVLTAGSRNGSFNSFFFPSNAVTMQLSDSADSVIARVSGLHVAEVVLSPPMVTSSNVTVCWRAESNTVYRLEFTPNLSLTNWNAVTGEVFVSDKMACMSDALTSSNRFYRVRIVP